ncbi:hypothetical protein BGW80DRAFT_1271659 [Lactifluus volemus]|nr:hypothetical protein BGW80DRAFT_1271659 [Lactifluus volemus]
MNLTLRIFPASRSKLRERPPLGSLRSNGDDEAPTTTPVLASGGENDLHFWFQ